MASRIRASGISPLAVCISKTGTPDRRAISRRVCLLSIAVIRVLTGGDQRNSFIKRLAKSKLRTHWYICSILRDNDRLLFPGNDVVLSSALRHALLWFSVYPFLQDTVNICNSLNFHAKLWHTWIPVHSSSL